MKVIRNSLIPFPGYIAVTLWPFVFVRRRLEQYYTARVDRHERIHGRQQLEMLILPFYLWYALEWLVRLIVLRNGHRAYRAISFEQEAYVHEDNPDYLDARRPYAWLRYLARGW